MHSRTISVTIERGESGRYFARSSDLPGFAMTDLDRIRLISDVPIGIEELLTAQFGAVLVTALPSEADDDTLKFQATLDDEQVRAFEHH
ncbi:hypothetical protein [Salinarimonas ramus]|nr:hypothetical protein [Salinarimonas ramus]